MNSSLDRAYPVVKAVYLRLDSIDKLSKHLDDLEYLATTGYEIIESLDKITSISDAWLKIFEGQGGQEAIDEILKHLDSMEEISPYIEDISKVAPYIQDIITVAEQIKDVSLIYDFYTSVEDVKETKELVDAALEEVQESVEYVQGISWEKIPYIVSTLQEVASYDKDGFFCITGDTEHSDAGDSTWITYPLATEQEAKAGTANNALMTPLRTRDAIKAMISGNNGLVVKSNGEIVVDFDQMPDEQLENIVLAMVQEGGGLSVDSSGKLYVDFASMPTDKFEDMLKSIRVPIWLTGTMNFYVNPATGVDNSETYGRSEDKPFKTLKYALTYVTDTFNTSSYNIYINLAEGVYDNDDIETTSGLLTLPEIAGSGTVWIGNKDPEKAKNTILHYRVQSIRAIKYTLYNLTLQPVILASNGPNQNFIYLEKGYLDLYNVYFNAQYVYAATNGNARYIINANVGSTIRIYASNTSTIIPGVSFDYASSTAKILTISCDGGNVIFSADLNIVSSTSDISSNVFFNATNLSVITRTKSTFPYPGREPLINILNDAVVTGKRYSVDKNSIIGVMGAGDEFLPGTVAGTANSGGQYV